METKKRILYITNARIPTEKAHGLQIVRTVENLVGVGAKVKLVVPRRRNPIKDKAEDFYHCTHALDIKYLPNPFLFIENILPELFFPLSRLNFAFLALLYITHSRYEVVYTRDLILACFVSVLSKKTVVYEDHEPKKSKLFLYKFFLKHIDKKVIVAKGLERLYEEFKLPKSEYVWVPNGVDIKAVESANRDHSIWQEAFGIPENHQVVLYTGHFYSWKGVYTLLDSAKFLPDNFSLVLIGGRADDQASVKEYIKGNNLNKVYLCDFMPQIEVLKYVRSADVLVIPNTAKDSRSLEFTTPIKLFEYMAAGVPIVASDIPSLRFYLEHKVNAWLFEPDNPESLSEGIKRVGSDTELGSQLSSKSKADVVSYTWRERAKRIINFIEDGQV